MKTDDLVIWKFKPLLIKIKMNHVKKIGGRRYRGFCNDYGDVPVCRINPETKQIEECVNHRGNAYAARNRLKYRKKIYKYDIT